MGCDIHTYAEKKTDEGWEFVPSVTPFDWRAYGMFGFLAGVRNYSAVTPLAERRGMPDNVSDEVREEEDRWGGDGHSHSWLSVQELTAFNYDAPMEDRRVTRNGDGGCTCEPGEGEITTFREFLGCGFFEDLGKLLQAGAHRIVFWFDN